MRKIVGVIPLLLASSAIANAVEVTRIQYLMGTLCEIRASGKTNEGVNQAITEAFGEISRLEEILSTYRQTSEVSELNRLGVQKIRKCSFDLFALLKRSMAFSQMTRGAFDATVHPLLRYWSSRGSDPSNVNEVLRQVGYRHVELNEKDQSVLFKVSGMSVDFGGIGKGYALDQAGMVLKRRGIEQAELNFSGNILIINSTIEPKRVLLADPMNPKKTVLTLAISNGSVSTSSQLERKNHIIDPRTGQPADFHGSVTVIAPSATQADALSTALLVLGPNEGISLIETGFKDSAALFLIPAEQGWTQTASSNFNGFLSPVISD